jgi:hypothetical protein
MVYELRRRHGKAIHIVERVHDQEANAVWRQRSRDVDSYTRAVFSGFAVLGTAEF